MQVRLEGAAVGTCTGHVTIASTGAAGATVAVTGTVLANLPPVITGLPDATNIVANTPLQFDMLATDPDGSVLQLAVSSATISDATSYLQVTPGSGGLAGCWIWTPAQAGSHSVVFSATDNEGGITTQAVNIVVTPEWRVPITPGRRVYENFNALAGGLTAEALLPIGWRAGLAAAVDAVGTFADAAKPPRSAAATNLSPSLRRHLQLSARTIGHGGGPGDRLPQQKDDIKVGS